MHCVFLKSFLLVFGRVYTFAGFLDRYATDVTEHNLLQASLLNT